MGESKALIGKTAEGVAQFMYEIYAGHIITCICLHMYRVIPDVLTNSWAYKQQLHVLTNSWLYFNLIQLFFWNYTDNFIFKINIEHMYTLLLMKRKETAHFRNSTILIQNPGDLVAIKVHMYITKIAIFRKRSELTVTMDQPSAGLVKP